MSTLALAWSLPSAAALLAMAAWGGRWNGRSKAALAMGLLSPFLPPLAAIAVATVALAVQPQGAQRWGVPVAAVLLALLRLRMDHLPVFSGEMAFWGGLLALVGVMAASQQLLAAEDAGSAGLALARGQVAWVLFGILSPAPLGWSGALLLLWQQGLLRLPLARVLDQAPGRIVLAGLLFLGLAGGPPLGAFNAYFQLLAPLMTESATVATMQAKLFTSTGLLAVLAILALLYQTGAFGYFYWARVLPAAPEPGSGSRPLPQPWAWACSGMSLFWGLAEHWGGPGRLALHALQAVGVLPNS